MQYTRWLRLARRLFWLLLTAPLAAITYLYLQGHWYYGEYLHASGDWSAKLLILALALTPLRQVFPRSPFTAWLLGQRRYVGLAAFGYAAAHLLAYLGNTSSFEVAFGEALESGMLAGWVAVLIFVPLALTSNGWSLARLGGRWKSLHRLVYIAAVLTFVHWVLVAFDPMPGYAHAAVLLLLGCVRLAYRKTKRRGATEP